MTLNDQLKKIEDFRVKHKLLIHPRRERNNGLNKVAEVVVTTGHCPCKPDRLSCPCNEALKEIQTVGHCECRLFCTKEEYDNVIRQENQ